jgi:hypothetical protein
LAAFDAELLVQKLWCLRTLDGIVVVAAGTKVGKRTAKMVDMSIIIVAKSRTGMAKGTRTRAGAGMECRRTGQRQVGQRQR